MKIDIDMKGENLATFLLGITVILGIFKFTALCLFFGVLFILAICSQMFTTSLRQFFKDISEIAKNIGKDEENPDS